MTVIISPSHAGFKALLPYWQVTFASFMGWFLDGFDLTTFMFAMPDIATDMGCTISMLGGVLLGQSIGRFVGNTGWGWLADRYGRKPAFIIGVIWFAIFSALTGFSHSLFTLMIVQFLFGIGFGGEWTASATLLMETVPETARPVASALMMSGYELGYLAAAGAQALILPHFGWRVLFFIGVIPAFLSLFIRIGVKESPVWLAQRRQQRQVRAKGSTGLSPKIRFTLSQAALQAIIFMTILAFQKAALYTFYPTILRDYHHLTPQIIFWPIMLYCLGSLSGKILCGKLAEYFGTMKVMMGTIIVVMIMTGPFLCAANWPLLLASAFIMGGAASGIFALVPYYLAQRFPSDQRSFGMGLSYALGSLGQGLAGKLVPFFGSTAATLPLSAIAFVLISSLLTAGSTLFKPRDMPEF
ncbi:MFS transporter [Acetobacteraceae bacterium ESL0709]|nr:MFS transporter [Acetobacteraceae bacterium ESL0697]MDF7677549.1 MFS transporter [Acetobacteraceae bacterium ESL0709]